MFERLKAFLDDGLPGERSLPVPLAAAALLLVGYLLFH